jgi:hypothetical protein
MPDSSVLGSLKPALVRANIASWAALPVNERSWLNAMRYQIRVCMTELLGCHSRLSRTKKYRKTPSVSEKVKQCIWQLRTLDQIIIWQITDHTPSPGELSDISNHMQSRFPVLLKGNQVIKSLNTLFRERKERERILSISTHLESLLLTAPVHATPRPPMEDMILKEKYLRSAYYFWKRIPRTLVTSIPEDMKTRFFHSLINVIAQTIRLWTIHRKALGFSLPPPWLALYEVRGIGSSLSVSEEVLSWLTKQLSACSEIIKESRRSVADFAKNRFMIPRFHLNLYEPMETVRVNMDRKLGESKSIKLYFKDTSGSTRQLESICVINTETGNVLTREFPRITPVPNEPHDSHILSDRFKKRRVPKSPAQATSDLISFLRYFRTLLKNHRKTQKNLSPSNPSKSASGPMSFTKFLSSSFGSLEFGQEEDIDASVVDSPIEMKPGDSFFDIYLSKTQRLVEPAVPPITRRASPPLEILAPVAKPAPVAPPPVARPPAPVRPSSPSGPQVGLWSGCLEGPTLKGGAKEYKLDIALFPFFRFPRTGTPEYDTLVQVLRPVVAFQFEGAIGGAKFADHYGKLMAPAVRKRREPFSFLVGRRSLESTESEQVFAKIPPNTATAFTAFIPPYKLKLWLVRVDDETISLPVVPGFIFGFMEIPPNVFVPTTLVNIFGLSEIHTAAMRIKNEHPNLVLGGENGVIDLDTDKNVPTVLPTSIPVSTAVPPPPNNNEALARVFEMMNQTSTQHPLAPKRDAWSGDPYTQHGESRVPVRSEPDPPRNMPSYPFAPPSYQSRSSHNFPTTNFVFGAPSSGPTVDQLPNPKKGACKFFNLPVGCQSGSSCKYGHMCSVCGAEDHPGYTHDCEQRDYGSSDYLPRGQYY